MERRSWADLGISIGCLAALAVGGCEASDDPPVRPVTLAWDAPTRNEDGTRLRDLAGYRVYHGPVPGTYTAWTDVGKVTEATVHLAAGTYRFAVVAYDTFGNESELSDPIEATLP